MINLICKVTRDRGWLFFLGVIPPILLIVPLIYMQFRTVDGENALMLIETSIEADPCFQVIEYFEVPETEAYRKDSDSLDSDPKSELQVVLRSSQRRSISCWRMKLYNRLKWLPHKIRRYFSPYLLKGMRREPDHIEISVLNPTDVELKKLKDLVQTLRISNDMTLEVTAYRP